MQYAGEKSYPVGVRWDEPIGVGQVLAFLEESARKSGDRVAIEFRDRQFSYRVSIGPLIADCCQAPS